MASRVSWSILAFSWAWGIFTGSAVRPLHPVNLLASAALLVGAVTVWLNHPRAQLTSGLAGIASSAIMGIQYYVFSSMFGGDTEIRSNWGPFQFDGPVALFAYAGPPAVLFLASPVLVWKAANQLDRINEKKNA